MIGSGASTGRVGAPMPRAPREMDRIPPPAARRKKTGVRPPVLRNRSRRLDPRAPSR